jgi:DNA-binding MarR family transcriptional regulator
MKEKFARLSFLEMTINLRDSRLAKGTDLVVLYTLNSRVRAEDRYSCFPSLDSIADDAGLNVKTVKRSIDRLEKASLLQKVQRFDNSNVYYLNTALMQDEAEKNRAKTTANKLEEECMFALPRVAAKTTVPADAAPDRPQSVDNQTPVVDELEESIMDQIVSLLREHFVDHPTFALPRPRLEKPLQACIDMAGSGEKCLRVLTALCTDDFLKDMKARVAEANHLSGYIKGCFKDIMAKVGEDSRETFNEIMSRTWLPSLLGGPSSRYNKYSWSFTPNYVHHLGEAADWVLDKACGYISDLVLDDRSQPLDEGDVQVMTFSLSQGYEASVILASHAGGEVDPIDLELRDDLEVGAVARWAVADSRWADRLKGASDVGEFFLSSLDEIIRDRAKDADDDL